MLAVAGSCVAATRERPRPPAPAPEVEVTLQARLAAPGRETVSFGVPLPPGFLKDARFVRLLDARSREIPASVRPLEPWRIDGKDGSIRSVLVQFTADFSRGGAQSVKVVFGRKRRKDGARFVPIAGTLRDPDGLDGPRVLAVLPAKWLCDSWIAGPQVPASESGPYAAYDEFVERSFPGALQYKDSKVYDHWLFDRTACWYKMYVRTGDPKYLEAAYHAAHFVRLHTKMGGPNAGIFTLKGVDLKYVYPRAMHLHYLLTGDERMLEAGRIMARFCVDNWDPKYVTDRRFWTPRHEGYGLLGVLHGWELTGDPAYWRKAREYADALYDHQRQPPDGLQPDGSWRQNWQTYASEEALFRSGTSAWMTAILLDPLFHYWTLSGDPRVPEMVSAWCDFLDRRGLVPDGSEAYYVINAIPAPGEPPGRRGHDMFLHNTEMAYMFAMGIYFSDDPERAEAWRRRFDALFPSALKQDINRTVRAYNWAFQASSQMVYFLKSR